MEHDPVCLDRRSVIQYCNTRVIILTNCSAIETRSIEADRADVLEVILPSPNTQQDTFNMAVLCGSLRVLRWAASKGYVRRKFVCDNAARIGNIDMLRYLRSINCSWTNSTCGNAIKGGHLDVLKWLRANDCPWGDYCYYEVVATNRLDIFEWLILNGCPLDRHAALRASENGRLTMLQLCVANGCRWDMYNCKNAAIQRRHFDIVRWIEELYQHYCSLSK
jgi:hypothetical protein